MKDQMQYIVIEGRKPQDGTKPAQALLILPKWISPTLACAGIAGRVIELADGNIIERGAVFMGEQETLDSLRIDIRQDAESQQEQEFQLTGSLAPFDDLTDEAIDALAESMPGGVLGFMKDWGYRQFAREVQARYSRPVAVEAAVPITKDREFINRLCLEFGAQLGDTWQEWLREQLEELTQFRKDRPETLAKLQAAEDNLDAWRDAAGGAGLGQECDEKTGQVKRLFVVPRLPANDMDLNTLCGAYGCLPGEDRMVWLQRKLNELVQAHGELGERDEELSQLRQGLDKIRKTAKKALR